MLVLVGEPQGFCKFATPNGRTAHERTSYKYMYVCIWQMYAYVVGSYTHAQLYLCMHLKWMQVVGSQKIRYGTN